MEYSTTDYHDTDSVEFVENKLHPQFASSIGARRFLNLKSNHVVGSILLLFLIVILQSDALGKENVALEAGFESGRIRPTGGSIDAFRVRTLPEDQVGQEVISTGSGGGAANSGWDLRVVKSEVVGGQKVTPRKGQYFSRFLIDRSKNYQQLNDGLDRPRTELDARTDQLLFDFDTEVWFGVSIFVPKNFQDEMKNDHLGGITLFVVNTDSSATFMTLRIHVPAGGTESHWYLKSHTDDSSIKDSVESRTFTDLGPVRPDKGRWTDFVIRMRANPFSVDTNPASLGIKRAFDQLYRGNKGILQVWKSEGQANQNGDRQMVLRKNVLNAPVGLVPGIAERQSKFHSSLRIYKSHWQLLASTVDEPIWIGFDEYRQGSALKDATGYSDVHPSGQSCTDRCPSLGNNQPNQISARPKTPQNLTITK